MTVNKGQAVLLGALAVGGIVLFLQPWKLGEDPAADQAVVAAAEAGGEEAPETTEAPEATEAPQATEAPEVTEAPEATEGESVPEEGEEGNGDPEASPTPTGPPANLLDISPEDYTTH